VHAKTEGLHHGRLHHGLYDRLIFNKIKKGLGMHHLRLMVSGSAPLSENVMTFFRCMLGVPVIEGEKILNRDFIFFMARWCNIVSISITVHSLL